MYIAVFCCDVTLTFSDLNDARIPLRKELTFSATLVVGRFRCFGAVLLIHFLVTFEMVQANNNWRIQLMDNLLQFGYLALVCHSETHFFITISNPLSVFQFPQTSFTIRKRKYKCSKTCSKNNFQILLILLTLYGCLINTFWNNSSKTDVC